RQLYAGMGEHFFEETQLQLILRSENDADADMLKAAEAMPLPMNRVLSHQRAERIAYLRRSDPARFRVDAYVFMTEGLTEKEFAGITKAEHDERVEKVVRSVDRVASVFKEAGIRTDPLGAEDIWSRFFFALNPFAKVRPEPPTAAALVSPREWLMQSA